ncbi:MAG: GH1 family beta-glucosidase [Anaerolineales bacterium]|nr:GH1 family beta-glucosidase [Anaerolineales bacterium]
MNYQFPEKFLWGVAASAYQIEGAYREDGKGESIWDRFTRWQGHILNNDNGDVACDHYHRYKEDVALIKSLGIPAYGFSPAWTRILPEGKGAVNQKGLDFYSRLVDELLNAGVQPKINLFHWDLPQTLQDVGGWNNRETADHFADYARIVFDLLADRVSIWSTHNEPWVSAFLGHALGVHAPGICDYSQAYQAAHHLLLSHGKAVQIFRQGGYKGNIGLVLNLNGFIPASNSEEDLAATQRVHDETHASFLDPVFKGIYPQALFEYIGAHQPKIQAGDLDLIHQPIDFLGLNHYNSDIVSYDLFGGLNKARITPYSASGWGRTEMNWGIHPLGLKNEVMYVKENYGNPALYLNENGCAMPDEPDANGFVRDWDRIRFVQAHLQVLHEAIQDGANVKGYFLWSVFDNFEWERGFSKRFGIVRVDFDSLERTPKQSAYWYRNVIANNGLNI